MRRLAGMAGNKPGQFLPGVNLTWVGWGMEGMELDQGFTFTMVTR